MITSVATSKKKPHPSKQTRRKINQTNISNFSGKNGSLSLSLQRWTMYMITNLAGTENLTTLDSNLIFFYRKRRIIGLLFK
jgi:hypothetical protein